MQARPKRTLAVLVGLAVGLAAFAATSAEARKAGKPKAPPPPNADQQEVIAQIINDTFRRPRISPLTIALCLDVQIEAAFDEDEAPPPPPPRHGRRKAVPAPEVPPLPVVRGAPPELVAALARPWRLVATALSCRLDPRAPFTLNDAAHTPAQLVTLHLAPDVASGTVKIDWTSGHDPTAGSSRDCTATRAPRGWSVHCGGTWFQ
ncbi:MAG: hypothetical protein JWM82_2504 [Myxococcales bacterium]|nr:hypothetical protein [Myxococcales bacterium]